MSISPHHDVLCVLLIRYPTEVLNVEILLKSKKHIACLTAGSLAARKVCRMAVCTHWASRVDAAQGHPCRASSV